MRQIIEQVYKQGTDLIVEILHDNQNKKDIFDFVYSLGYTRGVECPEKNFLFLV
jgi:hypothetical protein